MSSLLWRLSDRLSDQEVLTVRERKGDHEQREWTKCQLIVELSEYSREYGVRS
jgi:hypothetical protein